MASRDPTGTRTDTELDRDGTATNSTIINTSGAKASFQLLTTYTTASPPNRAGKMLSKAGFKNSELRIGVNGASIMTPTAMMRVVTMEEVRSQS